MLTGAPYLFISATVDGTLIGRSQILNVPVAEYAKQTGVLTKEILKSKTWYQNGDKDRYYTFSDDTVTFHEIDDYEHNSWKHKYQIDGNNVFMIESVSIFELFIYSDNKLLTLTTDIFTISTMKRLFTIAAIASALSANAQIGYQVSLLDNATGEPRADETVTVEIAITDSKGKTTLFRTQVRYDKRLRRAIPHRRQQLHFHRCRLERPTFLHLSHCRRYSDWTQPNTQRTNSRICKTSWHTD